MGSRLLYRTTVLYACLALSTIIATTEEVNTGARLSESDRIDVSKRDTEEHSQIVDTSRDLNDAYLLPGVINNDNDEIRSDEDLEFFQDIYNKRGLDRFAFGGTLGKRELTSDSMGDLAELHEDNNAGYNLYRSDDVLDKRSPFGWFGNNGKRRMYHLQEYTGKRAPMGLLGQLGKRAPLGFMGQLGKRGPMGFMGQLGKRGLMGFMGQLGKRGPMGFMGQLGKRAPMGFMGQLGKRAPIGFMGQLGTRGPMGFMGQLGKRAPMGFLGQLGKRAPMGFMGQLEKRAPMGFMGQLGKRAPAPMGFMGQLGKRSPLGLYGQLGKRLDDLSDISSFDFSDGQPLDRKKRSKSRQSKIDGQS